MATKKPNKADRINEFIMQLASMRAQAHVTAYLSKHPMGLDSLNEAAFSHTMSAITQAMLRMYSAAVGDTLDVVDGRELEEVK